MFELRVLTGRHQGAALPLCGERWVIGRSGEADLQLTDDDVASCHGLLLSAGDGWRLEALEGGWRDASGAAIGAPGVLPVDAPFAAGGAWLCVSGAATPWGNVAIPTVALATTPPAAGGADVPPNRDKHARGWPKSLQITVFSLMVLLTITVASWILQPSMAQISTQEPQRPYLSTLQELRPALLAMLRDRGLTPAVRIDMDKNKLILYGSLDKEQQALLARMLLRFRAQYTLVPKLVNNTRPRETTLPFRIVQITSGARANVVTDKGDRLFIGDEVDQLRLVAITANEIVFNGRDEIKVKW
ncbi:FHA domain-containing protein [Acerihabitans arboris]|uniref:Type III secretion protein n=1 Tax=Acerihabitans arboris TaxID=2691583 RepID=A0A845SLD8_9GAMM|nr:FHA domain-containing protein [Acerihabitans arboris]NDL63388.1 type III secretion protein [Acerihabitans arboris]